MTSVRVVPAKLSGNIQLPPSKSQTMRALVFAALAKTPSKIHNPLPSPDTECMVAALHALGAEITPDYHIVPHPLKMPAAPIYAGNSGLVYRLIRALMPVEITGDDSIQTRRPIQPLIDGLSGLPHATIDGADSQPVSALLIAMSKQNGTSTLRVQNPGETPFVQMTLSWFDKLGIPYTNDNYEYYTVTGTTFSGFDYIVPSDWSSAAFPWALGLKIEGTEDPDQGDAQLLKRDPLAGGAIDINDMIDTLPILAALGSFAKTPTHITGAHIARFKESDRIAAMTTELRKMGARIDEQEDGMIIYPTPLHGAKLNSHGDHRVAMALIVAALNATSQSIIYHVECIAKSFPNYIQEMNRCSSYSALQVLEKTPLAVI